MRGFFTFAYDFWRYFSLAPTSPWYVWKAGVFPQSTDRSAVQCLSCGTNTGTRGCANISHSSQEYQQVSTCN